MAFSTRYIDEYQDELRIDLKDTGALWSDAELDRCVQRAVDDLSRFYPLEAVYEHTIDYTVTDEASVAPAVGTWKDLAYKPIKPESETITTSGGGSTYTRDTDYTMDYANGRYTIISGGDISESASIKVSYTKSRLGIDISAIITDLIRVVHVIYPVDMIPQQRVSFNIWNDFMYIGSQKTGESQTQLADKKHIAIYYEKPHTAPLVATAPSYPAFLDQVICIGASAYALLMMALKYEHQAVTDIAYVDTALDKIDTEMTALDGELTSAAGVWSDELTAIQLVDSTLDTGADYLSTGDALINTVNVGDNVPELYRDYANIQATLAERYFLVARAYEQKRADLLTEAARYVDKADAWNGEAQNRIANAGLYLEMASRWRQEGLERRNEFWSILRDKAEYRKRISSTPVKQPA